MRVSLPSHRCPARPDGAPARVAGGLPIAWVAGVAWVVLAAMAACNVVTDQPSLDGKDVTVRFIHTCDVHSRLVPYRMKVALTDQDLGLASEKGPFGGAARMATVIRRLRAEADRSLHVDSGDVFQGAPIFNAFQGEVEMRFLSEVGVDVMSLGNHEFDSGEPNVADKIARFANFPILAANYRLMGASDATPPPLLDLVNDWEIFDLKGLRVGVIGLGNTSTMSSIIEAGNSMGITPIDAAAVVQWHIDAIRDQVDVIVVLSHLGLTEDYELIRNTTGIDIVFGGHHHIVLNPPKRILDCQRESMWPDWREEFDRRHADCKPREVVLVHSGAFAKYVGYLDAVFRQPVGPDGQRSREFEVASTRFEVIPIDATIPEDARVKEMLEPYLDGMGQVMQLDLILGYAPAVVRRFGTNGGDSALGNLVADSMWRRKGIETDFAITNTLGIRADLVPGPATVDDMYQVFPFENTITTMYLSGREVVEVFDYIARRSSSRGCQTQAQIAGARVRLQCGRCNCDERPPEWDGAEGCDPNREGCATSIEILGGDLILDAQYQLAANNYIAKGGSGFMVLKRNTTQIDSGIPQRDALMDAMRSGKPCGVQEDGELRPCRSDTDCKDMAGFSCACAERAEWNPETATCDRRMDCPNNGLCVLAACVESVAELFAQSCGPGEGADRDRCRCGQESAAWQQCTVAACLDASNGIKEDGRIRIDPP